MARISKIRTLPAELREQIHRMIDEGVTIDAITAHLRTLGADVSRSGVARYKANVDKVAARMRESRQMADIIMGHMGREAATGKAGAALIEMLTTLTNDYMLRRLDNPDAELEVDELRALARAVKERAQAARATQDYEEKIREQVRRETEERLREAARAVAGAPDAGPRTREELVEDIFRAYNGEA